MKSATLESRLGGARSRARRSTRTSIERGRNAVILKLNDPANSTSGKPIGNCARAAGGSAAVIVAEPPSRIPLNMNIQSITATAF